MGDIISTREFSSSPCGDPVTVRNLATPAMFRRGGVHAARGAASGLPRRETQTLLAAREARLGSNPWLGWQLSFRLIVMLAGCGGGSSSADPGPAPAGRHRERPGHFRFRAGRRRRAGSITPRRSRVPARGVTVELLQNGAVTASTTTDATGNYSFGNVAPNTDVCAARARRDAARRCTELGFPRRRQRQRRRAVHARGRRVQHGRREHHAQSACRIRLDGRGVHGDALGRAVRDPRRGLRRRAARADRGAEHRVPGAALQLEHAERAGRRARRPGEIGSSRYRDRRRASFSSAPPIKTRTSTTGTSSRTSSATISSIGSRARTASAARTR